MIGPSDAGEGPRFYFFSMTTSGPVAVWRCYIGAATGLEVQQPDFSLSLKSGYEMKQD